MLDLTQVVGFQRDEGNTRKSLDKHGITQKEAAQIFLDPELLLLDDTKHSQDEDRYHALGETAAGRRLHVTFTLRSAGTMIRIISARQMNRKERAIYEKKEA